MAKTGAQSLAMANRRVGKSSKPSGSKIHSVEFTPAKGGLVSSTRSSDDGESYSQPSQSIHPSMSHAVQHLKSTLGHVYGADGEKS